MFAMSALAASVASGCGDDDASGAPSLGNEAGAAHSAGAAADEMAGGNGGNGAAASAGEGGADAGNAGAGAAGTPITPDVLPITLRFAPRVGGEDFACSSRYSDMGSSSATVRPVDFKFYVHDLRVVAEDGTETLVHLIPSAWQNEGVALLDFEDQSGSCANGTEATNSEIVGTVPFGSYSGIAFKLGVPFDLNHTNADAAEAPLNDTTMYWGWNLGRLFLSVMNEVEEDAGAEGGAGGATAAPFVSVLHLGSTGCQGDAAVGGVSSCAKPNRPEFRLVPFDLGSNVVVADIKAVLEHSDLTRDLCHSFSAEACSWPFDHLGLNWFTGSLTPSTQRFFRVE